MLRKKDLDPWIQRISFWLILFILTMVAQPAEAWFYQDPTPRVVESLPAMENSTNPENTVYLIKKGDTLLEIARKFQVELGQLIALNKLANPDVISVGQMLTIPAVGAGDKHPIVYQIKNGDTLWDIARLYGTDVGTLKKYNSITNENRLTIGQQLVVPVDNHLTASRGSLFPAETAAAQGGAINFNWPIQGIITSKFGRRWGEFHYGLDIAGDTGTSVKAAAGGIVAAAGWRGTYGLAVLIEHGQGYRTLYAHNSKIIVKEGDRVAQGQVIAKVGSTGRSTGPHVHFEVHLHEKALDPLRFLSRSGR